ncbi:hypothetical protein IQ238_22070 [Pleurocapsales cyanobacterium LEGE 06147]|nr:hypothetical protein [Pleurocapsales cyanobacterium LEGE 06147]
MRITNINASLPVNKVLADLLFFYVLSILFTYPYGIDLVADNSIRLPDLFSLAAGGFALASWLILGKSKLKLKALFPILPFFCLELILPIIGAIYYGPFSASLSSVRVLLLYLPVMVCCFRFGVSSSVQFERRLDKLFRITIILNLIYALVQLAVYLAILPEFLLITNSLELLAVDEHFNQITGLRVSGFFINTIALAAFGIVAMSYFLSKYKVSKKSSYLIYAMLALLLVLLSTSRVAYLAALLILLFNIITSKLNKSFKTIIITAIAIIFLGLILNVYLQIDYEIFFQRFIRLKEQGLEKDYSWNTRVVKLWPAVLLSLRKYPLGTLIPSFKVFGIIDSGYLTYYAQGKWLFIISLIFCFINIFLYSFRAKENKQGWSANFLRCLLIYLVLDMVVDNPMRSPTVIFALIYGLWFVSVEKQLVNRKLYYR